jgi:alkane 1-monooxygenase
LINLQRHPDHHARPDRQFPLLQTYGVGEAPQLPFGYPMTTLIALIPPLWRRVMNPRVRKWRAMFYPEITDWSAYSRLDLPAPK